MYVHIDVQLAWEDWLAATKAEREACAEIVDECCKELQIAKFRGDEPDECGICDACGAAKAIRARSTQ